MGKIKFKTTDAERMGLAKLLCYGLEWLDDSGMTKEDFENRGGYHLGGCETMGHIAACWICQKEFGGRIGIETAETIEALELESKMVMTMTPKKMKGLIDKHISSYRE